MTSWLVQLNMIRRRKNGTETLFIALPHTTQSTLPCSPPPKSPNKVFTTWIAVNIQLKVPPSGQWKFQKAGLATAPAQNKSPALQAWSWQDPGPSGFSDKMSLRSLTHGSLSFCTGCSLDMLGTLLLLSLGPRACPATLTLP